MLTGFMKTGAYFKKKKKKKERELGTWDVPVLEELLGAPVGRGDVAGTVGHEASAASEPGSPKAVWRPCRQAALATL